LKVALNTISQSNQTRGQNLAFLLQLPTELPGKYFQCPSPSPSSLRFTWNVQYFSSHLGCYMKNLKAQVKIY
jgi:hypothetical protein